MLVIFSIRERTNLNNVKKIVDMNNKNDLNSKHIICNCSFERVKDVSIPNLSKV